MQAPQPILEQAALRRIEQRHGAAEPPLMQRAGAAAAAQVQQLIGKAGDRPLLVAGPGNNGGDALVAALLLRQCGLDPVVVFAGTAEKLPADARAAHAAWLACGGELRAEIPPQSFSLAVDGLFGIGLTRTLEGRYAELVAQLNALPCPVLALDVPSGLEADTGKVLGCAVRADYTASFIALKPGLLTLDGPDYCGRISVHDLGLELDAAGATNAPALFASALQPRRRNTHKGEHGSAAIIGGAPGMAGAALLAGRAALHLGAGRVYVGMLDPLPVDPLQPELMLRDADAACNLGDCLALGPGLGTSPRAQALLRRGLAREVPLLLDADAINLLAAHPVLQKQLRRRNAPSLLTPHPAEAARLLGCDTATVQQDRLRACRELAERCRAGVVLKGCGSIIAFADGRWYVNTTGNPGLASAGSGDVLSGMAAALLAQGVAADQALLAATWLHGAGADACVAGGSGPLGLCASEVSLAARRVRNDCIHAGD